MPPSKGTERASPDSPFHGHETAKLPSSRARAQDFLAPAQREGELGRLGHYAVLKELGRGGMGVVFLAEDTRLHRKVALKAMLPEFARDPKAKERFLREARHAASIRHDNVVTVFQVDEQDDVPFLAMELLPGESLEDRLQSKTPLALPDIVRIGCEIAQGLRAAHEVGIIHRDIKPGNIWLESPTGRVKLLDFGLARPQQESSRITRAGIVLGTPSYMSPEQAAGKPIDHRSDLFSLGIVLYRMCTGIDPFERDSIMGVLTALAIETPPPLHSVNPHIPPELARAVQRLLDKDVKRRYQSASEVVEDLTAIRMTWSTTDAKPSWSLDPSETYPANPPMSSGINLRKPASGTWKFALLLAVSLFLILALVIFAILSSSTVVEEPRPKRVDFGKVSPEPKGEEKVFKKEAPATKETTPRKDGVKKEDAKGVDAKTQELTNSIGMTFVRIEPGKFMMGSPPSEPGRRANEPLHAVTLTRPYYIGKHEVTQEQFEKVMGYNPSAYSAAGTMKEKVICKDTSQYPVERVSWIEAKEFCVKLSSLEGRKYTLPTEAQWEYACRAKSKTPYAFGHSLSSKNANVNFHFDGPMPVGSFRPNLWGIHDMHGNAREWVEDLYDENYKDSSSPDPTGPTEGSRRVIRGASWANGLDGARSAFRDPHPPTAKSTDFGFRVVLLIE